MKYDFLLPDETIIMEGPANMMQILGVNKGGHLILTNRRLIFKAHALNFGSKFDEIPFSKIAQSGNGFSIFCPTPNMITISTVEGKNYKFVVSGKQKNEWNEKIQQISSILR